MFLLFNVALAFYNVGTIWAHEVDIFRTWRMLDASDFHRVQAAHWRKLPYWVFIPVGLALAGSIVLAWYRPDAPLWPIWCAIGCQLASHVLTAVLWGRWQAKLSRDPAGPNSRYLAKFMSTHWLRTLLITASALFLLGWAVDAMAAPSIRPLPEAPAALDHDPATPTFRLSGHVAAASGNHSVFVALWREQGFLERPVDGVKIAAGKPTTFQFTVTKGAWALSAFEDTNDNGELDTGVFGPKEPSGFWRKFTGWHEPKFDEVSTAIDRDVANANIELK
jgi:hypothetical protein